LVTAVVGVTCLAGGVAIGNTLASSPSDSEVSQAAKTAKRLEHEILEERHIHAEVVCAAVPGGEIRRCFATTRSRKPPFEKIVTPVTINPHPSPFGVGE